MPFPYSPILSHSIPPPSPSPPWHSLLLWWDPALAVSSDTATRPPPRVHDHGVSVTVTVTVTGTGTVSVTNAERGVRSQGIRQFKKRTHKYHASGTDYIIANNTQLTIM